MVSTVVVALLVALIQVVSHKMTNAKLQLMLAANRATRDAAQIAVEHARDAAETAASAHAMLVPAVAQLPKTRSRKTVATGLGETETEVSA